MIALFGARMMNDDPLIRGLLVIAGGDRGGIVGFEVVIDMYIRSYGEHDVFEDLVYAGHEADHEDEHGDPEHDSEGGHEGLTPA